MVTAAELAIIVSGRDDGVSKTFNDVEKQAGGLGKTLSGVGTIASGFLAAGVIQKGVGALSGFISDSIGAIKESNLVNAQLGAVLESTGSKAGVTADQVTKLAGALEKHSLFEDEAIIKGQNLLLTFTNIRNDTDAGIETFNDATQVMVDMAQAMGTDAAGSAIQLGKALNDPINGISALSRVGVSFSAEQKEQIKNFQESGDMASAQAVILQELTNEFGGSALAASNAAGASEVMKDKMNDLHETIGAKMLPISEAFTKAQLAIVTVIADKVIPIIEEFVTQHGPAIEAFVNKVVGVIQANMPIISAVFQTVFAFVAAKIEGFIQTAQGIIEIVTGVVNLVDDLIHGRWAEAWDDLKTIANGIIDTFIGYVKTQFGNLPEILFDLGKKAVQGLIDGMQSLAHVVEEKAVDLANKVTFGLAGKAGLDAHSPSRKGIYLGQMFVAGLAEGLEGATGLLNGAVNTVASGVTAGTASALGAPGAVSSASASGGGQTIHVHLELDGREIATVVVDAARQGAFRGVLAAA